MVITSVDFFNVIFILKPTLKDESKAFLWIRHAYIVKDFHIEVTWAFAKKKIKEIVEIWHSKLGF